MIDINKQVKTAKDFPEKIVTNIVGKKKEDICGYCGYPIDKCICQYKGGMLRGR